MFSQRLRVEIGRPLTLAVVVGDLAPQDCHEPCAEPLD
jgi:hypothetical protein